MDQKVLNLAGDFYVIGIDNSTIPAVELDRYTGTYTVLVFTSEANAKRYCHHRKPEMARNIRKLQKKAFRGALHQVGLIKIAREVLKNYKNIVKSFVFDHPGTHGPASFASVEDIVGLGRLKKEEKKKETNELKDFLDKQ